MQKNNEENVAWWERVKGRGKEQETSSVVILALKIVYAQEHDLVKAMFQIKLIRWM